MRQRLEEKNRMIEKKTQAAMQAQQERNRMNTELTEIKDHMDIKDRKINVLQRKVRLLLSSLSGLNFSRWVTIFEGLLFSPLSFTFIRFLQYGHSCTDSFPVLYSSRILPCFIAIHNSRDGRALCEKIAGTKQTTFAK